MSSVARLPVHVVWVEEGNGSWAGSVSSLDGGDRGSLVLGRWYGNSVGVTLPWPSGLGNDDLLALVVENSGEGLYIGLEEGSGIGSSGGAIEEWVAVDSAEVGSVAEFWVGATSDEGVDCDDWSSVAGGSQLSTGCSDGGNDGGN